MRNYSDLALALMALVWGAMFVVAKAALDDVSSIYYLALRFSLATVVLALLFHRHIRRIQWTAAALGLVLMAGYILQTLGLRHTTASKSVVTTARIVGFVVAVVVDLTLVPRLGGVGAALSLVAGLSVSALLNTAALLHREYTEGLSS